MRAAEVVIKPFEDGQREIVELERLLQRDDAPRATRTRIERQVQRIRAGKAAERDAAYVIDLYFGPSPNWAILHDLRFEAHGHVAQIDHLIINRLAQVWVCESKHFAEGVSVNEHGEWTQWWRGRAQGIPSPIEQNRRHITLLERLFDDGVVKAPKRLGLVRWKPEFRSLILVSDNARIGRPRKNVDGLDLVVKAEQLRNRLDKGFDAAGDRSLFGVIGKDGLEEFARNLAALDRPASRDWAAQFGLSAAPVSDPSSTPRVAAEPRGSGHKCASCAAPVSFRVVKYCWDNKVRFANKVYCFDCQKSVA